MQSFQTHAINVDKFSFLKTVIIYVSINQINIYQMLYSVSFKQIQCLIFFFQTKDSMKDIFNWFYFIRSNLYFWFTASYIYSYIYGKLSIFNHALMYNNLYIFIYNNIYLFICLCKMICIFIHLCAKLCTYLNIIHLHYYWNTVAIHQASFFHKPFSCETIVTKLFKLL